MMTRCVQEPGLSSQARGDGTGAAERETSVYAKETVAQFYFRSKPRVRIYTYFAPRADPPYRVKEGVWHVVRVSGLT